MDRRSFITALIGGMAAASVGGIAMAQAVEHKAATLPNDASDALPVETAKALDESDAEFSQYYRRRRYRRHYRRSYRRRDRRARPFSQR